MLPNDDGFDWDKVKSKNCDSDGNLLGACHSNLFLDNHVYELKFQDGTTNEYAANIIADKLFLHNGPNVNKFMLLKEIINHRSTDKAVYSSDDYEGDNKIKNHKKKKAC